MRTSRHDLASTLTSTIPAPGSNSGSFEIINYESGKCLGTSAGHDDADAVQWTCNGAPNQQWHWGGSFEGFTQLINGNDGGNSQCLGIAGGATNQGADAVGWTCNGLQNQFWLPSVTGGTDCPGFVEFQNLGSLYFLGVAGNSTNNGANVVQWHNQDTCNNQLWY